MGDQAEVSAYLSDESRLSGTAEAVLFPRDSADAARIMAELAAAGKYVTFQGGLTGITGGAVPQGGQIVNLSRMNRILALEPGGSRGGCRIRIQPGCTLAELRDALRDAGHQAWNGMPDGISPECRNRFPLFFPPDLTETGASLGGVAANNGSGARSFRYGAARRYIRGLTVVLPDGDLLQLFRTPADGYAPQAVGRAFELRTASGRVIQGTLPQYGLPQVKNAAGYFCRDNMPLIDLFIGMEGTLGLITELELDVLPLPRFIQGVTAFFDAEEAALDFVEAVRAKLPAAAALEFFGSRALDLLRSQQSAGGAFEHLPELKAGWQTAIYVELHSNDEDAAEESVLCLAELMEQNGCDADDSWFADGEREIERFKGVRHAVPEAVNLLIGERRKAEPGLTKLGTDLAVPDEYLREVLRMYRNDLAAADLDYVIFGHVGNNHLHVNILPRNMAEYNAGKKLYLAWARRVTAMGGTVSAEHGIGKLKREMLAIMYGDDGIRQMRELKLLFDPQNRLNRGNLFLCES